jgi:hypothetical protein
LSPKRWPSTRPPCTRRELESPPSGSNLPLPNNPARSLVSVTHRGRPTRPRVACSLSAPTSSPTSTWVKPPASDERLVVRISNFSNLMSESSQTRRQASFPLPLLLHSPCSSHSLSAFLVRTVRARRPRRQPVGRDDRSCPAALDAVDDLQAEHTQRPVQLSVIFACSSSRARLRLELNLLFALTCSCWLDRAFSASLGLRLSLELARCASSPLTATPLPRPPLPFVL